MQTIAIGLPAAVVVLALPLAGCKGRDDTVESQDILTLAQKDLANEPSDSDAAVILSRAIAAARRAAPEQRDRILSEARAQAEKARTFTISDEAPLPAGWPKPSLPGLIRIKTYPAVRTAWVRAAALKDGQFMTLFRHIKARDVAMTAPVVMEYDRQAVSDPAKMDATEAMAFLYRRVDQDTAGSFGNVEVADEQPVTVVSIGAKGAYTMSNLRKALERLQDWLAENKQWQPAGPPRVLGYNSPFKLFWKKYSEVQIPVSGAINTKTADAMPPLTAEEKRIIVDKGTERPFTGKYNDFFQAGTYVCRRCGAALYKSDSKFRSHCGWPSFDDEIPGAVRRVPDSDGVRTEIQCNACGAHLGHVFAGEGLTAKNIRHCVNSVSLVFRPAEKVAATDEAIFAGGCFWGVEHFFEDVDGVSSAVSGYIGGTTRNPTYEQVCTGKTGHAEAVRVRFDPKKVTYEQLARLFFEIHDPTQLNRQGPDVGTQYRSAVFYRNAEQKKVAEKLLAELRNNGYLPTTEVVPATEFYPAEDYHQDYIEHHPGRPICHARVKRFDMPAR